MVAVVELDGPKGRELMVRRRFHAWQSSLLFAAVFVLHLLLSWSSFLSWVLFVGDLGLIFWLAFRAYRDGMFGCSRLLVMHDTDRRLSQPRRSTGWSFPTLAPSPVDLLIRSSHTPDLISLCISSPAP